MQALATYERLYGADHAKTLEGKDELARLMIRTDRTEVGSLTAAAVFSYSSIRLQHYRRSSVVCVSVCWSCS